MERLAQDLDRLCEALWLAADLHCQGCPERWSWCALIGRIEELVLTLLDVQAVERGIVLGLVRTIGRQKEACR